MAPLKKGLGAVRKTRLLVNECAKTLGWLWGKTQDAVLLLNYDRCQKVYWERQTESTFQMWGKSEHDYETLGGIIDRYKPTSILDVGCGTGRLFGLLLQKGINDVVGVDISEKALRLAKESFPNVETKEMKLEDMSFGYRRFDLAISNRVLQLVPRKNIDAVIKKICFSSKLVYINELTDTEEVRESRCTLKHNYEEIFKRNGFLLKEKGYIGEQTWLLFSVIGDLRNNVEYQLRSGESKSMIPKRRIGIITGSVISAGMEIDVVATVKLIHIMEPLSENIIWVVINYINDERQLSSNATVVNMNFAYYIDHRMGEGPLVTKILLSLRQQLKILFALLKLRKKLDVLIFAFGADMFVFAMLFGKLLRKRIILRVDSKRSAAQEKYYEKPVKHNIALLKILEKVSYLVADKLLPESLYMVNLYNLHKYQNKIADGSLYVDASFLRTSKKLAERTYQIGYIGRFSKEKGVLEFAQSLLSLSREEHNRAIMIGGGYLKDDIEQILRRGDIQGKVRLTGWIQHEELPNYLNDIKIVVVPSYIEGLPNLVLEAMGCGCIVVATPIGGIPGVIKDGETGFIMENNSPDCIARNVIRALNHSNLEEIAENARSLVEKEYTYEVAVERYKNILATLK